MEEGTPNERAREQGARLRSLRLEKKVSKVALCLHLGFTSTQTYDLYEKGTSGLRFDRVDDWAAAFGISESEFVARVLDLPIVPPVIEDELPPAGWTFRGALEGHVPEADIDAFDRLYGHAPYPEARVHAEQIKQLAAEARRRNTRYGGGAVS